MEAIGTIVDRLIVKARVDLARVSESYPRQGNESACQTTEGDDLVRGHSLAADPLEVRPAAVTPRASAARAGRTAVIASRTAAR